MFSVVIIPDSEEVGDMQVFLKYEGHGFKVQYVPEDPELILHSDWEADGMFMTSPDSNISAICIDSSLVKFELSNYGSGDCGSLMIEVPNSPETTASFRECISKWKDAAKAMYGSQTD